MCDLQAAVADRFEGYEILLADGFDDCVIGVVERCGCDPYLVYDTQKIIQKLIAESDGEMDYHDAQEYFDFNIGGAWVGDGTPGYIDTRCVEDV
jgi:hypothetical protein